jgi:hypothetical protein
MKYVKLESIETQNPGSQGSHTPDLVIGNAFLDDCMHPALTGNPRTIARGKWAYDGRP